MPGSAARLADVAAGDFHPLEVSGRRQHLAQQLAVAGLNPRPLMQGEAGVGDPLRQLVAQALQLAQVEDPRLRRDRGDAVGNLDTAEGLGEKVGELALEVTDLAPQLNAGEALVDFDAEPHRAVSFEQIRHRPQRV